MLYDCYRIMLSIFYTLHPSLLLISRLIWTSCATWNPCPSRSLVSLSPSPRWQEGCGGTDLETRKRKAGVSHWPIPSNGNLLTTTCCNCADLTISRFARRHLSFSLFILDPICLHLATTIINRDRANSMAAPWCLGSFLPSWTWTILSLPYKISFKIGVRYCARMVMIFSWLQPQLLGMLGIFLYGTHVARALDLDLGSTGMFRYGPRQQTILRRAACLWQTS